MSRERVNRLIDSQLVWMEGKQLGLLGWLEEIKGAAKELDNAPFVKDEVILKDVAKLAALCVMCLEQHGETM